MNAFFQDMLALISTIYNAVRPTTSRYNVMISAPIPYFATCVSVDNAAIPAYVQQAEKWVCSAIFEIVNT